MSKKYIVNVPVTDLRREPVSPAFNYAKDPLQESQLLYGERIVGHEERDGWCYIEAIEQQIFKDKGWQGYPGWVKRVDITEVSDWMANPLVVQIPWGLLKVREGNLPVSMGTRLEGIAQDAEGWRVRLDDRREGFISASHVRLVPAKVPILTEAIRRDILALGDQLLGQPYLWGGRSAYRTDRLSSCDCSGLVGLLYRVQGIDLPRDAHDQFLKSTKVAFHELLPGDLLFLASVEKPQRMGHVMLYAGGDELLDTNITDRKAVRTTATSRFGKPFQEMQWGEHLEKYCIYTGRLNCAI